MKPPVLLLDDDAKWLQICCARLQQAAYSLEPTTSLPDALQRLAMVRHPVVVCDLRLIGIGERGGFELLTRAKSISEHTKVIIVTAYGGAATDIAREAMEKGAITYLTKPLDFVELDECIIRAIQSWRQQVEEMVNLGFLTDGPELTLLGSGGPSIHEATIEPMLRVPAGALGLAPEVLAYQDFLLRTDGSKVEVLESPAGQATGYLSLDMKAIRSSLQQMEQSNVDVVELKRLGGMLFEAVFSGSILAAYAQSLGKIEEEGLRLKLQIDSPELATLPWELLYHAARDNFLALTSLTPIVRYIAVNEPPKSLSVNPPLRILGVTSAPADQIPLDIEREKQLLEEALLPLINDNRVEISWLDRASPASLQAKLRGQPHILHFIGHGGYDPVKGVSALILEDKEGKSSALDAERLAVLVRGTTVRLVFWNACETARGMAQSIVRSGIPAAIGTRVAIADSSAIAFAREFYRALSESWPVDAAVVEGRKAVMLEVGLGQQDWAIPVLFMRSPDGVLFSRANE